MMTLPNNFDVKLEKIENSDGFYQYIEIEGLVF